MVMVQIRLSMVKPSMPKRILLNLAEDKYKAVVIAAQSNQNYKSPRI
jgi:hypothetical protein